MSTNALSAKSIKRNWILIDAKDQILGRLAVEVAKKLRGKERVEFVPYLDLGDYVVVTNAAKVKVTGKKPQQKKYVRHSGYPGGLRVETFDKLIVRRPTEIIKHAVSGMLPKNRLGKQMISKLHVFEGEQHTFSKQLTQKEEQKNG